jgi:hypothetical protein
MPAWKRLIWALLSVSASCSPGGGTTGPFPDGGHDVLFIGNSLTYQNDLPGTLADIAASVGDEIRVQSVALPNFALIDHFNGVAGSQALARIAEGGWEFVVLQQGPSSLPINRDSLILTARLFEPYIRQVGAIPALYMVWPSLDRFSFFDEVRISYQMAAEAVNGVFMPAGRAWITAWETQPNLPLYSADGFHPSALGTYLTALVLYERITGHDARLLPGQAVVQGIPENVPESIVRLLQRAAHETNQLFPP